VQLEQVAGDLGVQRPGRVREDAVGESGPVTKDSVGVAIVDVGDHLGRGVGVDRVISRDDLQDGGEVHGAEADLAVDS